MRGVWGQGVEVPHEPPHINYALREMPGAGDPSRLPAVLAGPILDQVEMIEERFRPYFECVLAELAAVSPPPVCRPRRRRSSRPISVPAAWSLLTQRAYCKPLAPYLEEKIFVAPHDDGVRFSSLPERWPLTAREKTLYYWADVNAIRIELERERGGAVAAPPLRGVVFDREHRSLAGVCQPRGDPEAALPPRQTVDDYQFRPNF